jgi:undecaprenyl-diphosphatase
LLFCVDIGKGFSDIIAISPQATTRRKPKFLTSIWNEATILEGWSSFPSHHAVLFFALSTGILFISKKVGAFALSYTALFIAFPRIYVGLHYPTDVIAGAIIGMAIALLGNKYLGKIERLQQIVNWSYSKPNLFYPLFFLLTFQIVNMFDTTRATIKMGVELLRRILA